MTNSERTTPAPTASMADARASETFTLWMYLNVLLRRRGLVVVLPVALALVTGTLSLLSQREYVGSASFVPQEPLATQGGGLGRLATEFGLTAPQANTSSPQFYADLLQSREVLREVVQTSYPGTGDLLAYFRVHAPDRDAAIRGAIESMRQKLSVSTDKSTGVVRLSVRTAVPALSAQIARRFLELVNDYNLRHRQSQGRAEREFVEQRLQVAADSLNKAEEALTSFNRRNRRWQDAPELVAEQGRLERAVMLRQQLYVSLAQSYESARIEEVRNTAVITVIESPEGFVMPAARGTIAKAVVAGIIGLVLAVVLAFGLDQLGRARAAGATDYAAFLELRDELASELRRLAPWRRGAGTG